MGRIIFSHACFGHDVSGQPAGDHVALDGSGENKHGASGGGSSHHPRTKVNEIGSAVYYDRRGRPGTFGVWTRSSCPEQYDLSLRKGWLEYDGDKSDTR